MANNSTALSGFPNTTISYPTDRVIMFSPTANLDVAISVQNLLYNTLLLPKTGTLASLPTSNVAIGSLAWATDVRMFNGTGTQEGAGVGTGGLVTWNGVHWKIVGTNVTAST